MPDNNYTKKYYKIKEVAEIIGVPQSTLRFWESEFENLTPVRSSHNQRYYTPQDIQNLQIIKYLIKDRKIKISAAKEYLKKNPSNISKKIIISTKLKNVREELQVLLSALNLRGNILDLEDTED